MHPLRSLCRTIPPLSLLFFSLLIVANFRNYLINPVDRDQINTDLTDQPIPLQQVSGEEKLQQTEETRQLVEHTRQQVEETTQQLLSESANVSSGDWEDKPEETSYDISTTTVSTGDNNLVTAFGIPTITFSQGYAPLFSDFNILRSTDDRTVSLLLNQYSGSGFISADYYDYGFFSAKIKLPGNYSAGIVVAFYTSNVNIYDKTHDELDFEFLGNIHGKPWKFQTNLYGNGSTHRGREERYNLWFDPAKEVHRYTIVWTSKKIIFYIDETPIREVVRNEAMGLDYPSKPMSLYATIWDASSWATNGGKYKVQYRYQPFVAEFSELALAGCTIDPSQPAQAAGCADKIAELDTADFATITPEGRQAMLQFRTKHMYYSYCYDTLRYNVTPPECVIVPAEQEIFNEKGRLKGVTNIKFGRRRHRGRRRGSRRKGNPGGFGWCQGVNP
ncbi:Xyloglucan:xyloglucosyl transferase [Bertholletia excelsa]